MQHVDILAPHSDADSGLPPVSSLGVVSAGPSVCALHHVLTIHVVSLYVKTSLPDSIASPQTNPLRDGSVLLLCFGQLDLGAK